MPSLFLVGGDGAGPKSQNGWDIVTGPLSAGPRGGFISTLAQLRRFSDVPGGAAQSMLNVGAAVYSADKRFSRTAASDGWTRDIRISVPVEQDFPEVESPLSSSLGLLTGDRWDLEFRRKPGFGLFPGSVYSPEFFEFDRVALFSGGLDSLTGAVESLGRGERLLLVSHYDGAAVSGIQRRLRAELAASYPGLSRLVQFRVSPRPSIETTTRSRTLLFLSLAALVADGVGARLPALIAENGFIGLNVPLTGARIGSYSTRTTHPRFMSGLAAVFGRIGLARFENPYSLMTKGEVLGRLRAFGGTRELANGSQSCSKAGARRFQGMSPTSNCGCCFPCLLRRAGMGAVGWDRPELYWKDAYGDPRVIATRDLGRDLRALLLATREATTSGSWVTKAVLSSGAPLESGCFDELSGVVRRGFAEVAQLVASSGCRRVQQFIA